MRSWSCRAESDKGAPSAALWRSTSTFMQPPIVEASGRRPPAAVQGMAGGDGGPKCGVGCRGPCQPRTASHQAAVHARLAGRAHCGVWGSVRGGAAGRPSGGGSSCSSACQASRPGPLRPAGHTPARQPRRQAAAPWRRRLTVRMEAATCCCLSASLAAVTAVIAAKAAARSWHTQLRMNSCSHADSKEAPFSEPATRPTNTSIHPMMVTGMSRSRASCNAGRAGGGGERWHGTVSFLDACE